MLRTSLILLLLAIVASLLGFSKLARTSTHLARLLFFIAICLAIAASVAYWYQM